jgi:folate-binding protein YgfZ
MMNAAKTTVLLVLARDRAVLAVRGKDRLTWLNGLVTCDLAPLDAKDPPAVYGLAVSKNGRILSDLFAVADRERLLLAVPRAVVDELRVSLDHYLIMEDAEVTLDDAVGAWLAHGPNAGQVLAAGRAAGGVGGAVDVTGLGGAVVLGQPAALRPVLEEATQRAGGAVGDDAAWEALRLERGVPRFGADFDKTTYPQEALLEKTAVSFNKGCYLGQEVVCMLEMRGHVKRRLARVRLAAGAPVPAKGASVSDDLGAVVGEVTSAALSPDEGRVVAFAMLKASDAEAGKALRVGDVPVEVVSPSLSLQAGR